MAQIVDNTLEARLAELTRQVRAIRTAPGGNAGPPGPPGEAGTITAATATGLASDAAPTVTLGGTPSARTLTFGIPAGPAGTITAATASALTPGATPTVTLGGTPSARTLAFGIPTSQPAPLAPLFVSGVRVTPGATSVEQTTIAGIAIPYPGWNFRVWVNIAGRVFVNANTRVRIMVRCGSGAADLSLPIITDAYGQSNDVLGIDYASPHRPTGAFTGAVRLLATVQRTDGTGAYDLQTAGMSYQVAPV